MISLATMSHRKQNTWRKTPDVWQEGNIVHLFHFSKLRHGMIYTKVTEGAGSPPHFTGFWVIREEMWWIHTHNVRQAHPHWRLGDDSVKIQGSWLSTHWFTFQDWHFFKSRYDCCAPDEYMRKTQVKSVTSFLFTRHPVRTILCVIGLWNPQGQELAFTLLKVWACFRINHVLH